MLFIAAWTWLTPSLIAAAAAVAILLLGWMIVRDRDLRRRIARLRQGARRLADGHLDERLPTDGPRTISELAEALNRMAGVLDERLQAVVGQRNFLQAVLSGMNEGVLAVDHNDRLISLNQAAQKLLGLESVRLVGRSIQELVRNPALQQFIARTLTGEGTMQGDMVLRLASPDNRGGMVSERQVQLYGAVLRDAGGQRIGAVIVLRDLTQLKRLESVRRDFVSNVSHEIKTPVAAIKASVETILDSSQEIPEDSRRFLGIIARQSDRLHAIIEDLLSLARLEQDTEQQRVPMTLASINEVLHAAIDACQVHAEAKSIRIELVCPTEISSRLNSRLLEQAVVNLLDNAIKYSSEHSVVQVELAAGPTEAVISVIDQGCGIEAAHLPRVFERFYRTDPARSRAMGGTGLGLAIVKHTAQAHGGRVSVDSVVGKGSTFRIHLPLSVER